MEIAIIIIAAGVILAILTAGFAGFVYILKVLGEGIANIVPDIDIPNMERKISKSIDEKGLKGLFFDDRHISTFIILIIFFIISVIIYVIVCP